MSKVLDLNADLGEGGRHDAELLQLVSSASIACGGHAGNLATMRRTIARAAAAGVAIGAHPGYEDPENFGRRAMTLPLDEVSALVRRQVAALAALAAVSGVSLRHVKPHGALYNQSVRDAGLAAAIVRGIADFSSELELFALPGSVLADAGRAAGLTVRLEGFADRRYRDDGSLMPRGEPGALILNVAGAVAQALQLAADGRVDTLCIHGDGPLAVEMLREIRRALTVAGVRLRP